LSACPPHQKALRSLDLFCSLCPSSRYKTPEVVPTSLLNHESLPLPTHYHQTLKIPVVIYMFNSGDVRCILYFFRPWIYMFQVLFAPIIGSTTAAYSHRLCMDSIGAGTGLGPPYNLSTVSFRLVCSRLV
jgi:hypothetical protein